MHCGALKYYYYFATFDYYRLHYDKSIRQTVNHAWGPKKTQFFFYFWKLYEPKIMNILFLEILLNHCLANFKITK